MDTMNWAGQTCDQLLQQALPLVLLGTLLTVFLITLAWATASLNCRAR